MAAVVETGSFTRASEVLGLSPSGVSKSISRLEERIGVRLLDRNTRSLHLTNEGMRLYEMAAPHLSGIEEAANTISGAAETVRGALRVSINPIFARNILAPHLSEFSSCYPDVTLTVIPSPDVGDLIGDGIDLSVRFGPQPPSSMTSRRLLETRVLTVATPEYIVKYGRPKSPEQLVKHNCIQYLDPQSGKPYAWEFHRGKEIRKVTTKGNLTFADADSMISACLAGVGIAQVLAISVESLIASGQLVELYPDWPGESFPLYAIRPSRRLPSAAVEAFLSFCVELSEKALSKRT